MKHKPPEGWKEVTLGEVAEFINGKKFTPFRWKPEDKRIIRSQEHKERGEVLW